MKTDPQMTKAVLSLALRQHDDKASPEARTIGGFCADVLLPLMTEHANSDAYKRARRSLIERGRSATNQHVVT